MQRSAAASLLWLTQLSLTVALNGCRPATDDPNGTGGETEGGSHGGHDGGSAGDGGRSGAAGEGGAGGNDGGASGGGDAGSAGTGGVDCSAQDNTAPEAPQILAPVGKVVDFKRDVLFQASPFVDPDTYQEPGLAELEIWRLKEGKREERVWFGEQDESPFDQLWLSQGTFEGSGAGGILAERKDYGLRARYRDDHPSCAKWSAFGDMALVRSEDDSSSLFDASTILDFYLEIGADSWERIDAEAVPPDCVPHHRNDYAAALTFEGATLQRVGLHAKGGCGSARGLKGKAGFKVDLEWDDPGLAGCGPERRLYDQSSLTFNNMVQDPAFAREWIAHSLHAAMGVPVPRLAYARLHVNGELWGLYLLLESFSRRFLERWFDSKEGDLYEGSYWCDLKLENVPTTASPVRCLEKKLVPAPGCDLPDPPQHELDHTALVTFIDKLDAIPDGAFYGDVQELLELDRFLALLAVDTVLGHWDGFANTGHNYRVYLDPASGRLTLLESGFDQVLESGLDPWAAPYSLAERCLANTECEERFVTRLSEALATFERLDFVGELRSLQKLTQQSISEDPRKEVTNEDYEEAVEELEEQLAKVPSRIRDLIDDHGGHRLSGRLD